MLFRSNKRAIEVLKPKCESGNYSACNDLAISCTPCHECFEEWLNRPDGFGNRRSDGYNIVLKTFHLRTRKMLVHPETMGVAALANKIRKIENWPQKGILFHDITPVLQSAEYFRLLVDLLVYRYMGQKIDVVAGSACANWRALICPCGVGLRLPTMASAAGQPVAWSQSQRPMRYNSRGGFSVASRLGG